jgi:hypothetical protein
VAYEGHSVHHYRRADALKVMRRLGAERGAKGTSPKGRAAKRPAGSSRAERSRAGAPDRAVSQAVVVLPKTPVTAQTVHEQDTSRRPDSQTGQCGLRRKTILAELSNRVEDVARATRERWKTARRSPLGSALSNVVRPAVDAWQRLCDWRPGQA